MSLEFDDIVESVLFTDFLFENLSIAIFVIDSRFELQTANKAFYEMFQIDEQTQMNKKYGNAVGCAVAWENSCLCGSTDACKTCTVRGAILKALQNTEETVHALIERKYYLQNKIFTKYLNMKLKCIQYKGEKSVVFCINDVTEYEEQKNLLQNVINKDFLTDLYNPRFIDEFGQYTFENAKRGNITLGIAVCAIDGLSEYISKNGRIAGDFLLSSFASILKKIVRLSDIIIRYTDEEFCLLLSVKKREDTPIVIDRIRKRLAENPLEFDGIQFSLTVSAGISTRIGTDLKDMISKAQKYLHKARKQGINVTVSDLGEKKEYIKSSGQADTGSRKEYASNE